MVLGGNCRAATAGATPLASDDILESTSTPVFRRFDAGWLSPASESSGMVDWLMSLPLSLEELILLCEPLSGNSVEAGAVPPGCTDGRWDLLADDAFVESARPESKLESLDILDSGGRPAKICLSKRFPSRVAR